MALNKREKDKKTKRYADAKAIAEKQQTKGELTTLKLPKGVKRFRFTEAKKYRLLVVPYEVKHGNEHCDDGMYTWERTYYAHAGLGPDGRKSYVCPYKEKNEKCAIHEEAQRLRKKGGDADLIKQLEWPKKRQLIAIVDLDDKEAGVQVYEGPYNNGLGELIDNKVDASDEDSPYRCFFHEDRPMKLIVKVVNDSFQGRSFMAPANLEMEAIKPEIVAKYFEDVVCLDDCLDVLDHDELRKILDQTASGDDDEEKEEESDKDEDTEEEEESDDEMDDEDTPAPSSRKKKPEPEEDSDDEDEPPAKNGKKEKTAKELGLKKEQIVMYKGVEYEITNISGDGTSLTLEEEDGTVKKGVNPNEVKLVKVKGAETEDDEEEEKPKGKAKKPPVEEDDDEETFSDEDEESEEEEEETDEESDDEDDPPPKKPAKKPGKK